MITKHLHFEGTVARGKGRRSEHFELRPDLLDGDVHLALLFRSFRDGREAAGNITMNFDESGARSGQFDNPRGHLGDPYHLGGLHGSRTGEPGFGGPSVVATKS